MAIFFLILILQIYEIRFYKFKALVNVVFYVIIL